MSKFDGKKLNLNIVDWDLYLTPEEKLQVTEALKGIQNKLNLPSIGRPMFFGTSAESHVDKYWFKNYFK